MKKLSLTTKLYLAVIYAMGAGLLIWSMPLVSMSNLLMLGVLLSLASVLHIYKVVGATERSHYTFSFLIYGFTFIHFGIGEMILVILVSNLAEWMWNRPAWYIQLFNISCYFVAAFGASIAFSLINPDGTLYTAMGVLSVAVSMAVFTILNHFILGIVLLLARGETFKISRMLDLFPFLMDTTLLMFGCLLNLIWEVSPYSLVLFLFPLYLIYTTLRIPSLERKTEIDQKTGLFNHNYFVQHMAKELDRAQRFDRPLSVIMLDLDLLRNINNTYGHLAGDEVLIGVARILKQSVREYDVVARFGGEEFAIMLPETTVQQTFERAEVIRHSIQNSSFAIPTSATPIKVTISLGISERESFNQTTQMILHNADTALYNSKLHGRNQTFAYSGGDFVYAHQGELKVKEKSQEQSHEMEATEGNFSAANVEFFVAEKKPEIAEAVADPPVTQTPPEPVQPRLVNPVPWFIGGLFLLALGLFFGFSLVSPESYRIDIQQIWLGLLASLALVVVTELSSIDLYFGKASLSTSAVPILAGTLLFGPVAGFILSVTYAIASGIKYRSKIDKYFFNFSNQLSAAMIYTIVLQFAGVQFGQESLLVQALSVTLAAQIVYIMNSCLISIGMGLDLQQSPAAIWKEQYAWLATIYGGIGLISAAYVFAFQYEGVPGVILMMAPLFLLRLSQKQYVDRTRAAVTELREKNIILEKNTTEIRQLNDGLLDTLAEIIDLRDPYVLGHSKNVSNYATTIAEILGLSLRQIELVRKGGLLHDIGKLGIPTEILVKPTRLTPEEYEIVKSHAALGGDLVKNSPSLRSLIPIIRHHHEFYNGKGYPDCLAGNKIPIEARIISVADAIEAMSSDRPYRKALAINLVIRELLDYSGSQFDPLVVDAAMMMLEAQVPEINTALLPVNNQFRIKERFAVQG